MTGIKRFMGIAAIAFGLLLTLGSGAAFADSDGTLYIDGRQADLQLWIRDETAYIPVKELADRMGWDLSYDGESDRIAVRNAWGDELALRIGRSVVAYNGKAYEIAQAVKLRGGSAYAPLRVVAEAMHVGVGWRAEDRAFDVRTEEPYSVASGDTLASIAEEHGTTAQELKIRNGLESDAVEAGQRLKVLMPQFADPAAVDAALLAKIVEIEAGNEPYEGKLAVANVVLNRVHSGKFPDTIRGVIFAPGQFPPAGKGMLETETASGDSLKAAQAALSGENNVPGALYFFNPKLEPDKARKVDAVKKIGSHLFVR